ncbi:MAG TPA: c-type cytochrome, partial [Pedobacter sp.]
MRSISLFFRSVAKSLFLVSFLCIALQVSAQNSSDANATASQSTSGSAAAEPDAAGDAGAGAAIFKQKCTACHAIDRAVVGPALKGISDRHDRDWLVKWIKNSQTLVA